MKLIEKYINFVGEKISYLIPIMVLLMIIVIVSRYFFGIGRTDLQELVMYFHALVFLGCAGYVMNMDEHVRVDIFYRNASNKYKNRINSIFGFLFLLPIIIVTFVYSLETIEASWKMKEFQLKPVVWHMYLFKKLFLSCFQLHLWVLLSINF